MRALAGNGLTPGLETDGWPEIDTSVAHVARVYDYLLGGKANFAVDRDAAEQALRQAVEQALNAELPKIALTH